MAAYKIFFKASVWKDFKSIPDKDLTKILSCIESLSDDPRRSGCKKLSGQERYRLRYGKYRIIYSIQDTNLPFGLLKLGIVKMSTVKEYRVAAAFSRSTYN